MTNTADDVYAFVHIPKTGGTSIVTHIEKNIPESERLRLYSMDVLPESPPHNRFLPEKIKPYIHKYMNNLDNDRLEKLRIIYGHRVSKDLEKYFLNKNFKYIGFFRDPATWVVSIYNHFRTEYYYADDDHKKYKKFDHVLKINNKVPNFETWLNKKFNKGDPKATWSYKYFLDLQNLKLKDFYFVGIDKSFLEDSLYFYSILNFNNFFIRRNISKKFYTLKDEKIKNKIYKLLDKDVEIYKKAIVLNETFRKDISDYYRKVQTYKIKRKLLLPFTQSIYSPIHTARILKKHVLN